MTSFDAAQFCSIGEDCEFGIVQHKIGGESPSLLKYAMTPAPALLRLLRDGFDAMLDRSALRAEPGHDGQFIAHNDALGVRWHAWAPPGAPDAIGHDLLIMRRLLEWFSEARANGARIFVRKSVGDTREQAQAIAASIMPPLLWVTQDPARHGEVARDGCLWHGYLRALQDPPTHDNVDLEGWRTLLGRAADVIPAGARTIAA